MNILFILTGSIAAAKATLALSELKKRGFHIRVAATESALNFVGVPLLEGLTQEPVLTSMWQPHYAMAHIQWVRWADAIVLCPATANTLNQMAAGSAQDLAGAFFLCHQFDKPWLVFPAMNPSMWSHPITKASVQRLTDLGLKVFTPQSGEVACGETGEGRLLEPNQIADHVQNALSHAKKSVTSEPLTLEIPNKTGSYKPLKILITGGGTVEPLDSVRVIANSSTGSTSRLIAQALAQIGHSVTFLKAQTMQVDSAPGLKLVSFLTFTDLEQLLKSELREHSYDVVIHAAAVSDYKVRPEQKAKAKWPSDSPEINLTLVPNPKLISQIRGWSKHSDLQIVGFKLIDRHLSEGPHKLTSQLAARNHLDLVVENAVETLPYYRVYSRRTARPPTLDASNDVVDLQFVADGSDRTRLGDLILNALQTPGVTA